MILKDRAMGIISIMISLLLLFSLRGKGFETKAFPVALLVVLILLSILLIFDKREKPYEFKSFNKVLLYYILFFGYIIVMPYIGFIIASTCFMSLFVFMSKYDMKKIKVIILAFLVSFITWFIFSVLFGISLPEVLFQGW